MQKRSNLTLVQYFTQLTKFLSETHRLLEFCYAVNAFKEGKKVAHVSIDSLAFSLEFIENELRGEPNEVRLEYVDSLYGKAKKSASQLMEVMFSSLSYN